MNPYVNYRFVMSRKAGLLELGTGSYPTPPRRGEVVILTRPGERGPGGAPVPPAWYVVEQVAHTVPVKRDGTTERAPREPRSRPVVIVYVSLLDESGQTIPYERGPVPALVVVAQEPL